jgi:FkbM family methyltransferase
MQRVLRGVRDAVPIPIRVRMRAGAELLLNGTSIEGALWAVRKHGLSPAFCVDVGAYTGRWTRVCRQIFPSAGVLMVEAQESKRAVLEHVAAELGQGVALEIALLGSEDGRRVRFVEMETGSSVFEERSTFDRSVVEKELKTLDRLLAEGSYPTVDLLKLDVQGYELEVMRGASTALKTARAVLLEASFLPINQGGPLIVDVLTFMRDAGFQLFDLFSVSRRRDDILLQSDLLFVRADSDLVGEPVLDATNW